MVSKNDFFPKIAFSDSCFFKKQRKRHYWRFSVLKLSRKKFLKEKIPTNFDLLKKNWFKIWRVLKTLMENLTGGKKVDSQSDTLLKHRFKVWQLVRSWLEVWLVQKFWIQKLMRCSKTDFFFKLSIRKLFSLKNIWLTINFSEEAWRC